MRLLRPLVRFLLLVAVLWPGLAAAQADAVRVRLFGTSPPDAVTVTGAGTVTVDGVRVGTTAPGAVSRVERDGTRVRVSGGGVEAEGQSVEVAPGSAEATLHVVGGRQTVDVRGTVTGTAAGEGLTVVNRVPLPDYVSSVVASEYGFPEIEGVKAQAILARTYAVRQAAGRAGRAYDVDDHQGSQVYRGAGVETATSRRAERETRGQILTYAGQPAEALYSSSSGGHTADNETVWGTPPVPYLRGVIDPYDADAPDHTWRTTADAARVHGVLARRYGGTVTGIEIAERSREGRAVRVRLLGTNGTVVSGSDFRTVVNGTLGWRTVRSTLFTLSVDGGGQYVFSGGGFGHGVGMSQYGARGQARAGRSYLDILAFYFAGTQVVGGDAPAVPPAGLLASERAGTGGVPRPPTASPSAPRPRPTSSPASAPSAARPPTAAPPSAPGSRGEAIVLRPAPTVGAARPPGPSAPAARPPASGTRTARSGW